ncbi:MAG: hypothetical protein II820_11285 [Ruminiclostridium sp.]|nr:hypothetical protein [Ruminiclostridium sp.]
MNRNTDNITTVCPLFVCRICHTKTGHPHQKWCTLPEEDIPECESCLYRNTANGKCTHPYKKGGIVK